MEQNTLLEKRVNEGLEKLGDLDITSKDYEVATDNVVKLMDRTIEMKKLDKELKEDRKSRWVKIVTDVALPVVSLTVTTCLALTSFKFEENGSITTSVGRKILDKVLSKK